MPRTRIFKVGVATVAAGAGVILAITSVMAHSTPSTTHLSASGVHTDATVNGEAAEQAAQLAAKQKAAAAAAAEAQQAAAEAAAEAQQDAAEAAAEAQQAAAEAAAEQNEDQNEDQTDNQGANDVDSENHQGDQNQSDD